MVPRIAQPTRFDVLLGRGKPYQGHAGNIRLHKVVDLYKPRYSQARRHEKTEIAEEIVQFIKTPGGASKPAGRFLKRVENEELWVEVTDAIARDKVSHALRGKPRKEVGASTNSKGVPQGNADGGASSHGVLDEILSAKRFAANGAVSGAGAFPQKRQKLHAFSDFDILAGRHHNGGSKEAAAAAAFFGCPGGQHPGPNGPNGSTVGTMMQQQQLYASALAERQFAAGLTPPFMGMGGLMFGGGQPAASGAGLRGHHPMMMPHGGSAITGGGASHSGSAPGEVNPLLLQQLAAARQFRSDPRFWM